MNMAAVFAKLVSISIVANWLILAVILLRVLLKKAPRWITCILWALVAVRLVFPFSIESPVSLIPETTSIIQEAVDTNLIHPEVVPSNTTVFPAQEGNSNTYIGSKTSVSIIPFVWCFGVSLMLCYLVFSYFKMLWLVREAVPEREKIWVCDAVTTPFILGIIRPRIYLPSGLLEPNREYVIAHEQSHLRCNGITGFAGFNEDNVLIVHKENISQAQAEELNIRDGCCFGPVLIMNSEINMEAYNNIAGLNPRTAIGQRKDGAVIFVCIDGRQPSSKGGEYADIIDIMVEYGAVNACNMDGGSSTVMMYRDTYGKYGTAGQVQMINSYSLLQAEPRRMPDFWMVRPAGEE